LSSREIHTFHLKNRGTAMHCCQRAELVLLRLVGWHFEGNSHTSEVHRVSAHRVSSECWRCLCVCFAAGHAPSAITEVRLVSLDNGLEAPHHVCVPDGCMGHSPQAVHAQALLPPHPHVLQSSILALCMTVPRHAWFLLTAVVTDRRCVR
jgi:hypothetical protein